jgi:hypothetical protein
VASSASCFETWVAIRDQASRLLDDTDIVLPWYAAHPWMVGVAVAFWVLVAFRFYVFMLRLEAK